MSIPHCNFVKIQHDVIQNLGTFLIILQALTCNILFHSEVLYLLSFSGHHIDAEGFSQSQANGGCWAFPI